MTHGTHIATHPETGLLGTLNRAYQLRCSAVQIMFHSPRQYTAKPGADFCHLYEPAEGIHVVNHSSYFCTLTNPLTDNKQKLSLKSVLEDLRFCDQAGATATTTHPGRWQTASDSQNIVNNLRTLIHKRESDWEPAFSEGWDNLPEGPARLLLENACHSMHASLGVLDSALNVLGQQVGHDVVERHLGITLDTAHLYAAGGDASKPEDVRELIEPWSHRIKVVHFNNSRARLGSKRDGHGALKDGTWTWGETERAYKNLRALLDPSVPFVVEATDDPDEIEAMATWDVDVEDMLGYPTLDPETKAWLASTKGA